MKDTYIITGASRGIGEALAKACAGADNRIITTSRSGAASLKDYFNDTNTEHHHIEADLSEMKEGLQLASQIFDIVKAENTKSLVLVNNAGMLEPIAPAGKGDIPTMSKHISLNLIGPMVLSSALIDHCRNWNIPKTILNISSGAAQSPYFGWSSYCTSKAGLDMFTRTVGLEQEESDYPVRMLAVAPGIIDTQMQDLIRTKDASDFPMIDKFISFKEKGQLRSPEDAATDLFRIIHDASIPGGTVMDVRDA